MQVHTYVMVLVSSLAFCSCVLPESGGGGLIGVSGHSSTGGALSGATSISFGSNAGISAMGGSTTAGNAGASATGSNTGGSAAGGSLTSGGGTGSGGNPPCPDGMVVVDNSCVIIRVVGDASKSTATLDDDYH